jgi:hypothetical protein
MRKPGPGTVNTTQSPSGSSESGSLRWLGVAPAPAPRFLPARTRHRDAVAREGRLVRPQLHSRGGGWRRTHRGMEHGERMRAHWAD